MEGAGAMPGTISKHIRIDEELWKRLETAAGEIDTTANRLLAELGERWLETREWPQSEVQIKVARASVFTAQAIALDLIAAGRQKRVDQLLEHAASIVPGVAPETPVDGRGGRREERLQQGKLVTLSPPVVAGDRGRERRVACVVLPGRWFRRRRCRSDSGPHHHSRCGR